MRHVVALRQGSNEWITWRNSGLGASDAPVIEGISPYKTTRDLYFEKTGEIVEEDESNDFIFAKGHKIEAMVRAEFQKLVNAEINPTCMVHPKYEFLRASLDGFHPTHGVFEAKLIGAEDLKWAKEGVMPPHHYSQMQHQFNVSGCDVGQWYGHDGKKNGVLLPVRASKKYIQELEEKELRFWEMIQKHEAPPLTERDYLIPDDVSLLAKLRDAKEFAENAQAAYELMKEHVVNTYSHPKIRGAGIKLFRVQRQGALSLAKVPEIAAAIKAKQAELDEKYVESFRSAGTESWTIQIEKPKKAAQNV